MTIKLSSLSADIKKEREGDWIEPKEWAGLNPEKPFEMTPLPGLGFLVRSTNYPPYVTARQKAVEEARQKYPDGNVPPDAVAEIEGHLATEHLLLGWRGLDIEYSTEVAAQWVKSEENRTLRAMISWCAGAVGKRKVEFVEGEAKN